MFTTLISFLAGTAFRLIFGQVMEWWNKKQDHEFEVERMKLQAQFDHAAHERNLAMIRLQSDLKVGEIKIVGDLALQKAQPFTSILYLDGFTRQEVSR